MSRYDDDGEPSGTGGRPILSAIETAGVVDVICVVTRYFGGTKLGTGGLARAYGRAAVLALDQLPTRRVRLAEIRHVRYGFEDTGIVARVLAAHGAVRGSDEFSDVVRTEVRIPVGMGERLAKGLLDATGGRASLEPMHSLSTTWIAAET
jgi:putative IMPACT (imprinted ancient) family translation regulator